MMTLTTSAVCLFSHYSLIHSEHSTVPAWLCYLLSALTDHKGSGIKELIMNDV